MIDLLTPPTFDDDEKTLVARHLFIIVWTFMAAGWLALLIAVMLPETVYRWLLFVGLIESTGLILLSLNRRGHTRLVSNLLMLLIWLTATGMALTGGGTSSNAMAIYFIIVLVAGLLQRGRAVIVTAALCSLTGLFLAYLEYSGGLPANQVSHTPLTQWISNTIYMAIIISLQYLVSRTIRKALEQSRQELKERQRIDAALRESEELYTRLIATMPDIVVRMNLAGEILFVNDIGLRLSGYTERELIGKNISAFVAPEDRERAVRNVAGMPEGRLGPQEFRLMMRDGSRRLFEINGDLLRDEGGSPYGMVQICRDITKRKQVEDALRESESRFRSMIQSLSDMIFILDGNGRLTYESPSVSRILEYPPGYFIGASPLTHIHPDDRDQVKKDLNDVFQSVNLGMPTEFRHRREDGTWAHLEALGSNQLENRGIGGIILTVRDISERKRAEETIREGDERFRAIFNSTFQFTGLLTPDGTLIEGNPAALDFAGIRMKDVVGQPFWETRWWWGDEARVRQLREAISRANRGEFVRYEVELQGAGDTLGTIDFSLKPVFDAAGAVTLLIWEGRNITDRKRAEEDHRRLEERLSRAEKMEALGQLAGGVAHDLNNVLGILSGYSELLLQEIPQGQRSRAHAEKILQSTEKGAAIIQDLLTLARRGVTASDVISLNDIVSGFLKTPVFEKIKDHHPRVTFKTEFDSSLLNIKGSALHLEKTLMNLVSNAAESIPGMGEVTIRTQGRHLDQAIGDYDEVREGDYAVLTVSDTGVGIPAEDRERIFEPFYTKKKMGRSGTGLGLAIVWGTVKDHSGYIDVETEVGGGSTFTLCFPATREERIAPQQQEPVERYLGHGQSVLVVDDVAEQRDIAAQLLMRLGYRVHRASGGEEAVEYLRGREADILVLDMIMAPGIDGLETYRRILEIKPRQKAIIVSGFSQTERVKAAQMLGAGAYVSKPYTLEKIGVAIRDELLR